jgi:hypothetical protein
VWKDQIKVTVREITRGEQFDIFNEVRRLGLLDNVTMENAIQNDERIAELIAVRSTVAVYDCDKNKWKTAESVMGVPLPITPEGFNALPKSLANGWIEAAIRDNEDVLSVMSFPSASVRSSNAGSEPKSESESLKT